VGVPGALAISVQGTGHPLGSHFVGAGAVEVELGGLLRFCLGWIESGNAARTGGRSGKAGGGKQEVGPDRGCHSGWPLTWKDRHGLGASAGGLLDAHPSQCLQ
jgi:hypothetical protein